MPLTYAFGAHVEAPCFVVVSCAFLVSQFDVSRPFRCALLVSQV